MKDSWGRGASGYAIGIIGVDTDFPLIPGNVVNARTFQFPVYVSVLESVSGEDVMTFNPALTEPIIKAGQDLVRLGVRAVVGACGSFANYQRAVANALPVPTYMSVMLQVPLIAQGLKSDQSIAVIAKKASALTDRVFSECGIDDRDRLHIHGTVEMDQCMKLYAADPGFDSDQFESELVELAEKIVGERPDTGAIVIQCSELPPYSSRIQQALQLPVFDMNSLIGWIHHGIAQRSYKGIE